jgi:N-acetylmuramoyl-L-alanine amidase.
MNKIEKIVIHCSDSEWGCAIDIDGWHRAKNPPWKKIGYMGVILNGYVRPNEYWEICDGSWEWGRAVDKDQWLEPDEVGAHALGLNSTTVGICLIGKEKFSFRQLLAARQYVNHFRELWKLTVADVVGHYEVDHAGKTCPNINMNTFRSFLIDHHLIDDLVCKQKG